MRHVWAAIILLLAASLSHAVEIPSNPGQPKPGIETGTTWAHEKWGNPGKFERLQDGERKVLKLSYAPGDKDKTAFQYKPGFVAPADKLARFWVHTELEAPPSIAIAVATGLTGRWHECMPIQLKKGWQEVVIPLAEFNWKSEGTQWKASGNIEPLDDIRFVDVLIFNQKERGHILIEGFCPDASTAGAGKSPIDKEEYWHEDWKRLTRYGQGFIVWQSNRTGRWRIWKRNLDGSGESQLSEEDPEREHFAPHISPDGKSVVYLSVFKGMEHNKSAHPVSTVCPLRIVGSDGKDDRVLIPNARTYWGDRCAVWVSPEKLIYIAAGGATREYDLTTEKSEVLLNARGTSNPSLMNAKKTVSIQGNPPNFAHYDPWRSVSTIFMPASGCEPYFSHDGAWAFWMDGSGGPVQRLNLGTQEVSTIVPYHDPRLPPERNYVYFPMVSRCGHFFTFGASPNQHDHYASDYDIFVCEFDPVKFEMIGKPARYTFNSKTDNYPDVYVTPPELGYHLGEAPYTFKFKVPDQDGQPWNWSIGQTEADSVTQVFKRPGEYTMKAQRGGVELLAVINVLPAAAPKVLSVNLVSPKEIRVSFDEPVNINAMTCKLASGAAIEKWLPGKTNQSITIQLVSKLEAEDTLLLEGVTDLAQKPNVMEPAKLSIKPQLWPVKQDGLAMLWDGTNTSSNKAAQVALAPTGLAVLDGLSRMHFAGGTYSTDKTSPLLAAVKASGEMSLQMTIWPDPAINATEARTIMTYGEQSEFNFSVRQLRDEIYLHIGTGDKQNVRLGSFTEKGPANLNFSYKDGALLSVVNGVKLAESKKLTGGMSAWKEQPLYFGGDGIEKAAWRGRIGGFAMYSKCLSETEMKAEFATYRALFHARKKAPQVELSLVVEQVSEMPKMERIAPYRSALVACDYTVEKVFSGTFTKKKIRVVHWALIDGRQMPVFKRKAGDKVTLTVEPRAEQPQLKAFFCSDDLPEDWDNEAYFDVNL